MGQFIIHLDVEGEKPYVHWSTIVDAPIGYGMSMVELEAYVIARWGSEELRGLPDRIVRANSEKNDLLRDNRAGPEEKCLTEAEIIEWYCRKKVDPPSNAGHDHREDMDETCEEAMAREALEKGVGK